MEQKIKTFRERFNELCESSGKTNTELAKDLGVSNQTISAWKTGTRSPKEPAIVAIANYFRVNVRWLMGFDIEKEIPSNASNHYIEDSISDFVKDLIKKGVTVESLTLWVDATPAARRAAIAVLKSMKEDESGKDDNQ